EHSTEDRRIVLCCCQNRRCGAPPYPASRLDRLAKGFHPAPCLPSGATLSHSPPPFARRLRWRDSWRRVLTLSECLGVLNLTCPSFAFSASEYRSLWNVHVPSDLAQSNAAGVCGFDLLPNVWANSAARCSLR